MKDHRIVHGSGRRNAARWLAFALAALVASGCASTPSRDQAKAERARKAKAHLDLGVDHLQSDRIALGLRELRAAVAIDPENAEIHYALSEGYLRRGRPTEAEAHLVRALELYPEYHDARLQLSGLYIHQGRYEDAIAQSRILVDDPTFPAPWRALTNWGWSELQLGRMPEARQALEEAADYRSDYWPALLDLGILEAQEGRALEAIALFQRVLDGKPGASVEAETNFRIAEIYVSLGKRDRAVGHFKTAVARTPSSHWGKKSEEYLKLLR